MRINLLGPVEVVVDARSAPIGSLKRRVVLAALARRAGAAVSVAELVDVVWDGAPPRSAAANLRAYLSGLRALLGPQRILRTRFGYRLVVDAGDVDVNRFVRAADRGDAAAGGHDFGLARRELSTALDLWRGEPFAGLGEVAAFTAESRWLQERRLRVLEQRIDVDLQLGRAADLVAELTGLVVEHPYHERFSGRLMLALFRCGRQADALEVFQATRSVLREDLGIEPGVELRTTHRHVLSQAAS